MQGLQEIFKHSLFIIIFIFLFIVAFIYQNVAIWIILLLLIIEEIGLLILVFKYYSYFKLPKPKKWSEIKCNKCEFQGEPIHYEPSMRITILNLFAPIFALPKYLTYSLKQYPVEYGCPKCGDPRKNYKNIVFIEK